MGVAGAQLGAHHCSTTVCFLLPGGQQFVRALSVRHKSGAVAEASTDRVSDQEGSGNVGSIHRQLSFGHRFTQLSEKCLSSKPHLSTEKDMGQWVATCSDSIPSGLQHMNTRQPQQRKTAQYSVRTLPALHPPRTQSGLRMKNIPVADHSTPCTWNKGQKIAVPKFTLDTETSERRGGNYCLKSILDSQTEAVTV